MGNWKTTDRVISKIKDHPVYSIIIFCTSILGIIASNLTSVDQIWTFGEKRIINTTSEAKDEANLSITSSMETKQNDKLSLEQLNILVFDATSSETTFKIVVRELRREYPDWSIDAKYDWIEKNRNLFPRTLIFWQGEENNKHARSLEKRFSGSQQIRSYDDNPGGFFGFGKDRDVIVFIGRDWRNVLNGLRQPDNSLHISPD